MYTISILLALSCTRDQPGGGQSGESFTTGTTSGGTTGGTTTATTTTSGGTSTSGIDGDGDGVTSDLDCDDADPDVYPGAVEACDGMDNDCDPATDDAGVSVFSAAGALQSTHATVQSAVRVADRDAIIQVCPGTYAENLEIESSLTLRARDGVESVTLDGGGSQPTITVRGGQTVTLDGLVVTGGTNEYFGGGLDAWGVDTEVIIDGCVFMNNTGEYGAGAGISSSVAATITDTIFMDNVAEEGGGGLMLSDAGGTVDGVMIHGNSAGYGGGLAVWDCDGVSADGLEISDNIAETGAGIYIYGDATLALANSEVLRNIAEDHGGGAEVSYSGDNIMVVDSTDWGSGDDDNSSDDVYMNWSSSYTDLSGAFTCSSETATCE